MRKCCREGRARSRVRAAGLASIGLSFLLPGAILAQPVDRSPLEERPPQSAAIQTGTPTERPPSLQSSLGAFGDPGGLRALLEERGVTHALTYTGEVLGNASGGVRRGAFYGGKLEAALSVDLERLAGLSGLTAFVNVFQIHDTGGDVAGIRDGHFQRLITVSNIEAYPSTRLSEIWLERKWDDDRFGLRVGQLTADAEFFAADYGKMFISNDWPTITGANLPAGGPAYPLATPGARLRFDPGPDTSALFAVFNGNPGDPQRENRYGTAFRVNDPPLLIGEVQYRFEQGRRDTGRAGAFRLGGYHHLGRFDDPRYDGAGRSLADPAGSGAPRRLSGTSGLYGVVEYQFHRPAGGGPEDGVTAYLRVSASPSDRSPVSRWADGGVVFSGMLPERPDDRLGVSFIYSETGRGARSFDRSARRFAGEFRPVRTYDATIEVTYQAWIVPGLILQPVYQRVFRPAGGVANPNDPGTRIKGGSVLGLRLTATY